MRLVERSWIYALHLKRGRLTMDGKAEKSTSRKCQTARRDEQTVCPRKGVATSVSILSGVGLTVNRRDQKTRARRTKGEYPLHDVVAQSFK